MELGSIESSCPESGIAGGTGIFLVGSAHIGIIDLRWVHGEIP